MNKNINNNELKQNSTLIGQKIFIVISNFNKNNPLAEKRTEFKGTWKEASEMVMKMRDEYPNWYIGIVTPC